jgi:hypothetical protein
LHADAVYGQRFVRLLRAEFVPDASGQRGPRKYRVLDSRADGAGWCLFRIYCLIAAATVCNHKLIHPESVAAVLNELAAANAIFTADSGMCNV